MTEHHSSHHSTQIVADKPSYDDINTSLVITVGVISAILTYLSVVVVQAMTYQWDMNMIRARSHDMPYMKSVIAIEEQKEGLHANPQIQRLSIEQAMAETVSAYASKSQ